MEAHIEGYSLFRKDRNSGRGGGVCVYIKNYHEVKLRNDLMSDEIDAIWVEITIEKVNYLTCIVYRPPSAHTEYYEKI